MNVLADLSTLIREVFDAPQAAIGRATTANDVDGWDSLSHVNLIVSVEVRFGVKLTAREIMGLRNVGDLADAIERHLPKA
jgi:acyl carrier protein